MFGNDSHYARFGPIRCRGPDSRAIWRWDFAATAAGRRGLESRCGLPGAEVACPSADSAPRQWIADARRYPILHSDTSNVGGQCVVGMSPVGENVLRPGDSARIAAPLPALLMQVQTLRSILHACSQAVRPFCPRLVRSTLPAALAVSLLPVRSTNTPRSLRSRVGGRKQDNFFRVFALLFIFVALFTPSAADTATTPPSGSP